MDIIKSSAAHHYLTTMETLKGRANGWMVLYFDLAQSLHHGTLIKSPAQIPARLEEARKTGLDLVAHLQRDTQAMKEGFIYLFDDNDVLLLTRAQTKEELKALHSIRDSMAEKLQLNGSDVALLDSAYFNYRKMADQKIASAGRFEAYKVMADVHKMGSISVRRDRREKPVIMMVEDDRFTAAYASNIIVSEYDLRMCRTGEDALKIYADEAPDLVFLDIHLPGLNGLETLQAIRAMDKDAYIVMLSVDTAKGNIVQAADGGADKFLKKPFSKERILGVIGTSPHIRRRKLQEQSISSG